jgi:hypothetical protein
MIVLTIGLTALFNSYIIPTKLIVRLLHGIKSDIKGVLSWMKKKPKKDIFMRTLQVMGTKVNVQGDSLMEEDFKKIDRNRSKRKKFITKV